MPNDSCHPYEHKRASINYLMNRVNTYTITNEAKTRELNIIQDTLNNNEYNNNVSIRHSKNENNKNTSLQHQKTKWDIFTYSGKETKKITKPFKEAQLKIAFRARNTLQKIVKPHPQIDVYEKVAYTK
jgi:hypothetical protein